jgi:hypothetical protein
VRGKQVRESADGALADADGLPIALDADVDGFTEQLARLEEFRACEADAVDDGNSRPISSIAARRSAGSSTRS